MPSDAYLSKIDTFNDCVDAARDLLTGVAGLVEDSHGRDTPQRFTAMLMEMTSPRDIKWKMFETDTDQMIIVRNISFVSMCNHHVLPFIGHCDIGYVPGKYMAGLSKFARVVDHYSKSLNVQERLTKQIADYLEEQLDPRGIAVVMEAEHLCMTIRGAQAPGTLTYTAEMRGVFNDHTRTAKAEFLARLNGTHR